MVGYVERMENGKFVKKMYESKSESPDRRGRPLRRWKDRVKKYLVERGNSGRRVLERARRECWDRERWRFLL